MRKVSETMQPWQAFIAGPLYTEAAAPWREDPAFTTLSEFPGLRDSIGGRVAEALTQAIGLVQALTQIDLLAIVHAHPRPQGLCLGFGMNALEPYDLLQVFSLTQVHGYEWIREQVVEAAQTLTVWAREDAQLSERIRLHHGTMSDLHALPDRSIQVVYVGNVFMHEIPMTHETFARTVTEIIRVLDEGGVLLSRGSSGALETALRSAGKLLLQNPLVSVFQKQKGTATS
ncbi:MAG: class I SAM-dependent methyltransferase [Deltaproteobacteria bacterium]|nr:class I SAM-dependent methyltransferase [Deltaproteobacteria bacterium]